VEERRFAPATARNRDPIAAVLARVLPPAGTVLEVASGTGEHAVYFARRFPTLAWQPSDADPGALASIEAWRRTETLANLRPPLLLDVEREPWPIDEVDAVLCANMIHIAPWSCAVALLRGVGRRLRPSGVLVLYGPYRIGGRHTAPSNDAFDHSLRERDPRWGVRDLEAVLTEAAASGLVLRERVEMPANNQTLVLGRG
jgi:SAM-dependent methyltransferase